MRKGFTRLQFVLIDYCVTIMVHCTRTVGLRYYSMNVRA